MPALLLLLVAGVAATAVFALRPGRSRSTGSPLIGVVLDKWGWRGEFPAAAGERRCTVHGGGPPPGTSFAGTCRTQVELHADGSGRVSLTHVIHGEPHTWVYSVSPSLRTRLLRQFGRGIAPEYWR